jgi:hypothetical protein
MTSPINECTFMNIFIKRAFLFLLFFFAAFLCFAYIGEASGDKYLSKASICKMEKSAKPAEKEIEGCHKSACSEVDGNYSVCLCFTGPDNQNFFILYKGQTEIGKWPARVFMGSTEFEVMTVDLDNDGQKELVVTNLANYSMGMAVMYWDVAILRIGRTFVSPLQFEVSDYGKGTFLKTDAGGPCKILVTEWLSAKSPQGREGLYFTGRMFEYSGGSLQPIINSFFLARRFLSSFQSERGRANTEYAHGAPLIWLRNSKTGLRRADPYFDTTSNKAVTAIDATVTNIDTRIDSEYDKPVRHLRILTNSGENITYSLYGSLYGENKGSNSIDRMGDARSKKIYPQGYEPEDISLTLLKKKVRISTYNDKDNHVNTVLWIK